MFCSLASGVAVNKPWCLPTPPLLSTPSSHQPPSVRGTHISRISIRVVIQDFLRLFFRHGARRKPILITVKLIKHRMAGLYLMLKSQPPRTCCLVLVSSAASRLRAFVCSMSSSCCHVVHVIETYTS